jgi:MoxR-like ATPase
MTLIPSETILNFLEDYTRKGLIQEQTLSIRIPLPRVDNKAKIEDIILSGTINPTEFSYSYNGEELINIQGYANQTRGDLFILLDKSLIELKNMLTTHSLAEWTNVFIDVKETNNLNIPTKEELITNLVNIGGSNILLYGEAGSGKTFFAYQLAKNLKKKIVMIQCHQGMQSSDLLGTTKPMGDGFIHQDGELLEAFRIAQKEPVILIIDEILRLPNKERSSFLGNLSSVDGKHYLIKSPKPVNNGLSYVSEEIIIPVENLSVIATTNIGYKYDIEEMDAALRDRFFIFNYELDREKYAEVFLGIDARVINDILNIETSINNIRKMKSEYREAIKPVSLRTLKDLVKLSKVMDVNQVLLAFPELFISPETGREIYDDLLKQFRLKAN